MAQFLNHFHVILHALLDALRLDGVALLVEEVNLLHQVVLDFAYGYFGLFLGSDEEVGRIDLVFVERSEAVETDRVNLLD